MLRADDDHFEVIDGFKCLERWRRDGLSRIPVVIESPRSWSEAKAALLQANAPPRTVTAMDEARVIASMVHEDGMTLSAVGRLLGRKKSWVARRHALADMAELRLPEHGLSEPERRRLEVEYRSLLNLLVHTAQRLAHNVEPQEDCHERRQTNTTGRAAGGISFARLPGPKRISLAKMLSIFPG